MKRKALSLLIILALSLVACTNNLDQGQMGGLSSVGVKEGLDESIPISVSGQGYPMVVKDFLNHETTIESPFTRPAILSATPLNIWYDLGGKSVCSSDISDNVKLIAEYEEDIKNLPQVGPVYSINMEEVIGQEPDFIVAQVGTQGAQAKKLRDMGYNVVTTHIRGFDDVIHTYRAFGTILGNDKGADEKIKYLEKRKEELASKAPRDEDSVVILYISGNTIAAKLNNSIAGDIANILGLKNIASDLPPDTIGSENTPLDIEYIVEKNPKFVLVTSMVSSNEEAKKSMEEEFERNPVWAGIDAIRDERVIYLPQEYFLFNAGPYYDEAIEYMAMSLYPNIYGDLGDKYGK